MIFQYEIIILTHSCHLTFIFSSSLNNFLCLFFCCVSNLFVLFFFCFLVTAFHGIDFDWSWLSFNDVHLSHFVCHYHCGIHRHPSKLAFDTQKIRLDIRFAAWSVDSEHILFWFRSHFSKELTLFKHFCFMFVFFFPMEENQFFLFETHQNLKTTSTDDHQKVFVRWLNTTFTTHITVVIQKWSKINPYSAWPKNSKNRHDFNFSNVFVFMSLLFTSTEQSFHRNNSKEIATTIRKQQKSPAFFGYGKFRSKIDKTYHE